MVIRASEIQTVFTNNEVFDSWVLFIRNFKFLNTRKFLEKTRVWVHNLNVTIALSNKKFRTIRSELHNAELNDILIISFLFSLSVLACVVFVCLVQFLLLNIVIKDDKTFITSNRENRLLRVNGDRLNSRLKTSQ